MRTPLRVLILEDKASDAELMVYELRRAGFAPEWRWVKTEAEFLEFIDGPHDVILVDYNLPGYDALRALAVLKERGLEIPTIVVTGTVGEEIAVECIKKGADDYLLKDRMVRLGAAVRQAVRNRELLVERRNSEARILHLNKVLKAVREVNQLIVRERNPERLLAEACDVLVGTRGFRMVWIGLAEPGNDVVVPAAWAGEGADFLQEARINLAGEYGSGPTSTAILEGRPNVCQDVASDPRMAPWRRSALSRGFASILAAPIRFENRVFGALVGYKEKPHAFDGEEIHLLSELAGDIGFALQSIEERSRRKKAEEALRASEEYYRNLVEISPDAILHVAVDGKILHCNYRTCIALGYTSRDEIIGRNAFDMIAPEDARRGRDNFRKTMEVGTQRFNQYTFVKKDGSRIPVEASSTSVVGEDGKPTGLIVVGRDISERKRAEEDLKTSEKRFRDIADNAQEWIWEVDTEGKYTYSSQTVEKVLGYTPEEILQKHFHNVFHPDDRESLKTEALAAFAAKQPLRDFINRNVHKNGKTVWLATSAFPVLDEKGNLQGYRGVDTDITERKELEERFLQSQKMEAVGRLAGGVAHDFNNLLTTIIGTSSLLLMKLNARDASYERIRTILETGERGARLTRQLLAFSRKEVFRPEVLNLNEVIQGMSKMVGRLIGEDIGFRFLLDPEIAAVKADPGQIEQVVLNLVVNARDAMKNGGELYLSTDNVTLGEEDCRQGSEATPGEYVRLVVSDTGPGIPTEILDHIFEPFFTTREEGTGLGLSTVYGIVNQLGGHVSVDTALGRGSAFEIYIPALPSSEGEEAGKVKTPIPVPDRFMPKGRETILLVEDEPNIREMLLNVLSDLGYKVFSAESAEDALETAATCNTRIDLLLTDIVLPGKRGTDLAVEMKRRFADLQAIFMSGYTEGWIKEAEVKDGEARFLQKPFALFMLARMVRDVLDGPVRA